MSLLLTCCCISFIFSSCLSSSFFILFFFNDTATTEIYTLSLHDALPIYGGPARRLDLGREPQRLIAELGGHDRDRSEEHTSELQSRFDLVCRLLLEKKKKKNTSQSQPPLPRRHTLTRLRKTRTVITYHCI